MSVLGRRAAAALARVLALGGVALAGCDQYATIGASALVQGPAPMDAGVDAFVAPSIPVIDAATAWDAEADGETDAATDAGVECVAPEIVLCDPFAPVDGCTVCNPVSNVGCSDVIGMHCALDLVTPLSGFCTFTAPEVSNDCLSTIVTESCAPSSVCADGQCLKLCFCDSDCPPSQCCSIPIEGLGVSACSAC